MLPIKIQYGTLPRRGQFNRALLEAMPPNRPIRFRGDSRMGDADVSATDFFLELRNAHREGTADAMEWIRQHLLFISIHWV